MRQGPARCCNTNLTCHRPLVLNLGRVAAAVAPTSRHLGLARRLLLAPSAAHQAFSGLSSALRTTAGASASDTAASPGFGVGRAVNASGVSLWASSSVGVTCWSTAPRRSNSSNAGCDSSSSGSPRYDAYWPLPSATSEGAAWTAGSGSGSSSNNNSDSEGEGAQPQHLPQPPPPVVTGWPRPATAVAGAPAVQSAVQSVVRSAAMVDEVDPFSRDMREIAAEAAEAKAAKAAAANGGGGGGGGAAAAAGGSNGGGGDVDSEKAAPSVDVTRHNFEAMLPVVRRYLAACDFFSFDCEMTGLFLDGQNEQYLDDMQDRYNRTAAAAHAYIITQFGLSCFKRQQPDGPGGEKRYAAATFNFYLFPRPPEGGAASATSSARRFTCDAGSLAFLAAQGFDFNRCIYDGVPFMPVRQRDELLRAESGGGGNGGGNGGNGGSKRADVELSKPEDAAFVEALLGTVREWLASDSAAPLDLPPVNRYQRLLAYQALARADSFGGPVGGAPGWHPGFYVQKVADPGTMTYVRLVRCSSPAEAEALEAAEREEKRALVAAAAGFAAVWEAMRDSGRPAVGHNCMFDVAYGVAQFGEGRLPATWEGFKGAVAAWFRGGLYDTKHICRQVPALGSDTALGAMFRLLVPQPAGQQQEITPALSLNPNPDGSASPQPPPALPARVTISHAPGFEKYVAVAAGKLAHEAGYDAYMTGALFTALEEVLSQGSAAAAAAPAATLAPYETVAPYCWRLNVTRSDLPYALLRPADKDDPTSLEPVPERPYVFYLGQLSYGVRANDIHRGCEEAGLGKVRITFLPANNALIEVAGAQAAELVTAGALEQRKLSAEVLRYTEYRARKDAMLAAGTWPLPGYGTGSLRATGSGLHSLPSFGAGGGGGGLGGAGPSRSFKRLREGEEGAAAAVAAAAATTPQRGAAAAAAGVPGDGERQAGGWRSKLPRWLQWLS